MAALVLPPVSRASEIIARAVQENKTSGAVLISFPLLLYWGGKGEGEEGE